MCREEDTYKQRLVALIAFEDSGATSASLLGMVAIMIRMCIDQDVPLDTAMKRQSTSDVARAWLALWHYFHIS